MQNRENGFTLIEVLVATAVFALVISALYQGLQTGWRGLRAAEAEDAALAVATSAIAASGIESPLVSETKSGVTPEGISWQIVTRPYQGLANTENPQLPKAFWIEVIVRWKDSAFAPEKSLNVTTLKLGKPS